MAFAVPVFSETGDGEDPAGFWLGSIEIGRLLLSLLPALPMEGLRVQLQDDSAPADESLLFAWPNASQPISDLCHGKRTHVAFFDLGGKQWSLHTFYTPEHIALRRTDAGKWWRVAGLLLTMVTATIVARRTVGTSLLQRDAMALKHDLAESRRRFESVVTCMPDWVWETDAQGRYTYCSPRVRDILGYRPDELVGHSPFETMPDEEAKRVSAIIERYKIARDPFQGIENWNLAADGHLICILSNGQPIVDEQGVLQGYRGVNTEITDRVRAAADFAEALSQLKSILDAATQVGIVATNLSGEITAFNTGAERMLGYRAPEAIGKLNLTALHEPSEIRDRGEALSRELGYPVESFDAIVARVRHGGSDQTEWTLRRKDGSQLLASVSFTAMYDDAGNLSGFLAISHDITERKRGEEELRRLGRAVEQASDGIAITSLEGVIQFVNLGWAQMHGTSVESLLGKHISFFHTQQQYDKELAPLVDRTRRFGTRQGEVGHLRADGSLFPAWTSCTILEDESNHPIGFVHVASDITARKRSEEALRQAKEEAEIANRELERSVEHANRMALEAEIANQAKSEFLANMSHEIRTPMNGILGMGSLLLDTDLESEQADYVQTMRSCAESLLTIINDILDFSKIEAGKMDLEILDFDLRTTCDDMNSMLALRAQEKGLEYSFRIDPDVPSLVKGDPGRLRQVLVNLVGNAIKFTSEGEVSVQIDLLGETNRRANLRFQVADTGIGISPQKTKKLFAAFTQADASTTRTYGGTGLGLTISKRLVEMMGGQIGVESQEGEGSTFWFEIALGKQVGVVDPMLDHRAELRGKRIVFLEGNERTRAHLRELFVSWECPCDAVENEAALRAVLKERHQAGRGVDVAVVDLSMVAENGGDLANRIRHTEEYGRPLLVAMTSVGQRGDAKRLERLGFAVYLPKPVSGQQLRECVITALGQPEKVPRSDSARPIVTRHSAAEALKQRVRILLVEDNVINRTVALKMLERLGYRADAVWNGAEAVAALAEKDYELVLMDIQMPEMDGFEATAAVRAGQDGVLNPHVPIIAMTAHAMKGDREKCLEKGMDDYISKPIKPDTLAELLSRWTQAKGGPAAENRQAA